MAPRKPPVIPPEPIQDTTKDDTPKAETEAEVLDVPKEEAPKAPEAKEIPEPVIPKKKKSSGSSKKEPEVPKLELTPEILSQQVKGLHQIASMFVPGAEITEPQAKMLGDAIYEVMKDSNLEWLTKYGKYINLAVTVAIVEFPVAMRVKAIKEQQLQEKRAQQAQMQAPQKTGVDAGQPLRVVDGVAVG